MLAKKYRIPIQKLVGKRGQSFSSRYFLFKLFSNGLNFNRFGVIISKKVAKQATKRNRIKRLIFNSLRNRTVFGGGGKDYLIIVSPQIGKLAPREMAAEIKKETSRVIK